MAVALLPLYKKMQDYKDEIWAIQGGFYTPIDKLRTHEFRLRIFSEKWAGYVMKF